MGSRHARTAGEDMVVAISCVWRRIKKTSPTSDNGKENMLNRRLAGVSVTETTAIERNDGEAEVARGCEAIEVQVRRKGEVGMWC